MQSFQCVRNRYKRMVVYRAAYAYACDRLFEAGIFADAAKVPIDPYKAMAHLGDDMADDPQAVATAKQAIEDAREARRPTW